MANYSKDSLVAGEAVLYTARVTLWRYWFNILLGAVCAAGSLFELGSLGFSDAPHYFNATTWGVALLISLAILLWPLLARRTTELVITDRRLIAKFGVMSTHSIEIRFDKIESVRVTQGLIGRMLNYGDIVVTGTGSTFDPIRHIANAVQFRTALNHAMEPGGGARVVDGAPGASAPSR